MTPLESALATVEGTLAVAAVACWAIGIRGLKRTWMNAGWVFTLAVLVVSQVLAAVWSKG